MANTPQTKKRYRTLTLLSLDTIGTFNRGELIDTDQVPDATLAALTDQGQCVYVDTLAWNPSGDDSRGSWDAVPEQAAAAPTDASAAPAAPTDAPAAPADAPKAKKPTTDEAK